MTSDLVMPTCCGDPWQFWWIVLPAMMLVSSLCMGLIVGMVEGWRVGGAVGVACASVALVVVALHNVLVLM